MEGMIYKKNTKILQKLIENIKPRTLLEESGSSHLVASHFNIRSNNSVLVINLKSGIMMNFDVDKEEEEEMIIMFPGSSTKKSSFQCELKGGRRHCKKVWCNKLMENCTFLRPCQNAPISSLLVFLSYSVNPGTRRTSCSVAMKTPSTRCSIANSHVDMNN